MKTIKDLCDSPYDISITGITDDSREVKEGYLFVATKGFNVDHFDYIDDAINNGCSFIICDREIKNGFPHLVVDNVNDLYYELVSKFYDINLDDSSPYEFSSQNKWKESSSKYMNEKMEKEEKTSSEIIKQIKKAVENTKFYQNVKVESFVNKIN